MEKNKKKKFRDIRNAVVMMCVMIAMLSTASYAWFTMSDSPTVTGMQMTAVSDGGGLMVANTTDTGTADTYYSNIIIKDTSETKMLRPVTPNIDTDATAGTFKSPIYSGTEVTGLSPIPTTEQDTYVAKYTFWLKSTATETTTGETVGVGIIIGNSTDGEMGLRTGADGGEPKLVGSFVRESVANASPNTVTINPSYAVRVGLVLTETTGGTASSYMDKLIIWEPNSDADDTSNNRALSTTVDAAINTAIADYIKVQSKTDGTIVKGGSGNISDALFTIEKGKEAKIEMYVWIEGSDLQCGNEIQAGNLEAQIQFTTVDITGTTN